MNQLGVESFDQSRHRNACASTPDLSCGALSFTKRRPVCAMHTFARWLASVVCACASSRMKALVIGGGIIGSSIAWRLASEGVQVIVFERGRLGVEASWAAAGLIGPQAEAHEPGAFFDLARAAKASFDSIIDRLTCDTRVHPAHNNHDVSSV